MKYEEIKVGRSYNVNGEKGKVIAKVDKYKIVAIADDLGIITPWYGRELDYLEPIKEELPEEGLLVGKNGDMAYRTGLTSGYGFLFGKYQNIDGWSFVQEVEWWKPAIPEQEEKFIEMLKKECESRGLFEDTKIESHVDIKDCDLLNKFPFQVAANTEQSWNIHGQIFYKGKFATPLKTNLLDKVTSLANEFGNFSVEQTKSGVIVISLLGE